MARAKRTDRAEARRRYRAEVAAETTDDLDDAEGAPSPSGDTSSSSSGYGRRARPGATPPKGRPAPVERMSFMAALRVSYHFADIRGDLRALPSLIMGRSFLIPAAASLGSVVFGLVTVASPNAITALLVTLFLGPLPIGAIYAAGALAPRASWLMGGIASFVGTLGLVVYAVVASSSAAVSGTTPAPVDVFYALGFYTFFGALIGAGLGFYRRLLRAMNPPSSRPPAKPKQGTKAGARAH